MKQLLFPLLFLPCLALAQYPGNANQKITLGEQTTADGLVYRGVASIDTVSATSKITRANKQDTSTYLLLDTTTNLLWHYKTASNGWIQAGGSTFDTTTLNLTSRFATKLNVSDTLSMLSPYFRDADTTTLNLTSRFAAKQNTLTLTTTGSSGAATLVNSTLNIPQYSGGGGVDSTAINYVNTYGTQTVNGAKTFTSEVTATRFNPTANTTTGTGMYLPATNSLGFSTAGTQRIHINSAGKVGIGTQMTTAGTNDYGTLNVDGKLTFESEFFAYRSSGVETDGYSYFNLRDAGVSGSFGTGLTGQFEFYTYQGAGNINAFVIGNYQAKPFIIVTNAVERMRVTGDGEVNIGYNATDNGAYRLQVQDSVYVGGNVSASAYTTRSDYDLKDEIQNINYGINEVMQMQPVKYTYKSNGSTQLGFIAQDLGVITPEVVSYEDKMSVYYNALIPILTKAIQEQQNLIKALEQRIINLENK